MAKLSAREAKARKLGGSLSYKTGKITVAPKVKPAPFKGAGFSGTKSMAELGGMTPGMLAYQSQQEKAYQNSPQAKQDTLSYRAKGKSAESDSSSLVAEKRRNASKAFESSKPSIGSTVRKAAGVNTANASGNEIDFNKVGLQDMGRRGGAASTIFDKGADFLKGIVPGGRLAASGLEAMGFDLSRSLGMDKNLLSEPTGMANYVDDSGQTLDVPGQQSMYDIGQARQTDPFVDANQFVADRNAETNQRNNGVFGIPTAQASDTRGSSDPSVDKEMNVGTPEIDTQNDPSLAAEMGMEQDYSQTQNNAYGGDPITDKPGGTTRRPYGSGAFGTGKGVQSDDPYIKELRKAYSSNGGEKWLRKQFEELIASLDPTYAQMQKEGQDALQAQLLNNNNQLASVMNANNTGDSEQRAQLMAGQQRDSQTALGNLLAKLSQAKAGDVSQYKQQYAEKRGQLADRNQSNAQTLIEKIRSYQADQQDQAYKQQVLGQKGTKTPAKKNMSLTPISWGADGKPNRWVDQSTGDIFENQ